MRFSGIFSAIRRYYGMPMRRGAMMTWPEAKVAYFYLVTGIFLTILFTLILATTEDGQFSSFRTAATWSLVALFAFGITIFTAVIYGYHHRHDIDPGDEKPIDLSQAYLGGVLAAILGPIVKLIISLFGG